MATGVNPGDAEQVLKALLDVWGVASDRMLQAVAKRLARGITDPGWAEQKLREVLALQGELKGIVAQAELATPGAVQQALAEAYTIGQGAAGVLSQAAIKSRPEVVQTLATRLATSLQGTVLPVIRAHTDLFRRATGDVELLMQTGTITRRDAVAQAVTRLLAEGQDRFRDASGRRWQLDAYARMAGRTMAGQSMVQGQLDGMVERGRDLVVVSDSPRECPLCRPWEGRVLSISGASVGTDVEGRRVEHTVAEAKAAGLHHPNCTHRLDPFTPGLTRLKEAKANAEGYQEQQQLRALERRARELKRRETALAPLGDTPERRKVRAQIRANSARIKAHTEATGQLRRRDRERPVDGGSLPVAAEKQAPKTTSTKKPAAPRSATKPTRAQMQAQMREMEQSRSRLDREQAAVHADRVTRSVDRKYREPLHELLTNTFVGIPENKVARLKRVVVSDYLVSEKANAQYRSFAQQIETKPGYLARKGQKKRTDYGDWYSNTGDMEMVQGTFHHEFGHHLDGLLTYDQRQRLFEELAEADPGIVGIVPVKGTKWMDENIEHVTDTVGIYASTSVEEMLAELWAQYRGNGPKSPLSLVVGRWFEADNLGV